MFTFLSLLGTGLVGAAVLGTLASGDEEDDAVPADGVGSPESDAARAPDVSAFDTAENAMAPELAEVSGEGIPFDTAIEPTFDSDDIALPEEDTTDNDMHADSDGGELLIGKAGYEALTGHSAYGSSSDGMMDDVNSESNDEDSSDMTNGGDVFVLSGESLAQANAGSDLSFLGTGIDEEGVAWIDDFEPGHDSLELIYDDIGGAKPPALDLGSLENGDAEVYADGELVGVVQGGSVLTLADIVLIPASRAA